MKIIKTSIDKQIKFDVGHIITVIILFEQFNEDFIHFVIEGGESI